MIGLFERIAPLALIWSAIWFCLWTALFARAHRRGRSASSESTLLEDAVAQTTATLAKLREQLAKTQSGEEAISLNQEISSLEATLKEKEGQRETADADLASCNLGARQAIRQIVGASLLFVFSGFAWAISALARPGTGGESQVWFYLSPISLLIGCAVVFFAIWPGRKKTSVNGPEKANTGAKTSSWNFSGLWSKLPKLNLKPGAKFGDKLVKPTAVLIVALGVWYAASLLEVTLPPRTILIGAAVLFLLTMKWSRRVLGKVLLYVFLLGTVAYFVWAIRSEYEMNHPGEPSFLELIKRAQAKSGDGAQPSSIPLESPIVSPVIQSKPSPQTSSDACEDLPNPPQGWRKPFDMSGANLEQFKFTLPENCWGKVHLPDPYWNSGWCTEDISPDNDWHIKVRFGGRGGEEYGPIFVSETSRNGPTKSFEHQPLELEVRGHGDILFYRDPYPASERCLHPPPQNQN